MPDIEIIKCDTGAVASNEVVAYRHPKEDFGNKAQLLVSPGQMAYFMNEGEIAVFGPGHYTLDDSNNSAFRIINKFRRMFSNGESSFHCTVTFVNAVDFVDLRCASPNPIPFRWTDPDAIPGRPVASRTLRLQASGLMHVHIDNDAGDGKGVIPLITRVMGQEPILTKDKLADYLAAQTADELAAGITDYVNGQKIPLNELTSYRPEIAKAFTERMREYFSRWGIVFEKFSFHRLDFDEESQDFINRYEEQMAAAQAKMREMQFTGAGTADQMTQVSIAEAARRQREGYTYQQERGMDVMQTAAGNEAQIGQMMGLGVGFGVGRGLGPAFGDLANQSMGGAQQGGMQNQPMGGPQTAAQPAPGATCPNCGNPVPAGTKFCPNCGNKVGNFCPKCGAELAPGAKFCPNCGEKLVKVCAQCGTELAPGAKFCPNCGAKNE